jgi:hypothetical protein
MKKIGILFYCLILLTASITAAVPQSFKYQAVVRDNTGSVIANKNIGVRLSILKNNASGISVYTETHAVTTSNLGIINLEIGKGTAVSGNMQNIAWGSDNFFIKIEMDENGGSSYTLVGTSQLISVPYALFANSAANGTQWKDTLNNIYYNAGKVGIGTSAPKSALEVRDNAANGGRLTISGSIPTIKLSDTAYSGNGIIIGMAKDSSNLINRSGKGDLVFTNEAYGNGGSYVFGTGVPSETCVKITEDCKVGIGTDAPVATLDVRGDINLGDIGTGVIMKSPDGNCWRMTVSNTGQPVFSTITCPVTSNVRNNCSDAVACYPFNGNAKDAAGNHNGTATNAVLTTDRKGNPNSAYLFDGSTTSFIELPVMSTFDATFNEITISAWTKTTTALYFNNVFVELPDNPNDRFMGAVNYGHNGENAIFFDHGNIFTSGRVSLVPSPINTTTWEHYVFVVSKSGNYMKVYRDNVLVINQSTYSDLTTLSKKLYLGYQFSGAIDDVKIFNRALTATEVSTIYNTEK